MESLIEEFLAFMQSERAAAENTISNYRGDLKRFSEFCNRHPRKPTLMTADRGILQDYHKRLKEQGRASTTISRRFACLRSFFGYLETEGLIRENPVEKVAILKKITRQISRPPSNKEIERLLKALAKPSTPEALRDLAIIELLLATGVRPQELVALDTEMVNLDPRAPVIQIWHRREEREISLPSWVVPDLKIYLEAVRPELIRSQEEKALFLNRRGERLTRQGVWFIIRGYAKPAGLEGKLTPRALRYSFATQQIARGVSTKKLQELLGHTDLWTTARFKEKLRARN